ncbi:MAG TPA: hypothetical protein VMU88_08575 [bacterium]|nr:hypothetical protein [bacterium]
MKWNEYKTAAVVFFLPLFILWGCKGNQLISPTRVTNLSVSVPLPKTGKASLLGAAKNDILYSVVAPGVAPVTGSYGPFSTSTQDGSVNFVIQGVTSLQGAVLSLELVDHDTKQPLGIGAAAINPTASIITVELGSLVLGCYSMPPSQTLSCWEAGGGLFNFNGYYATYGYESEPDTFDINWEAIQGQSGSCTGTYDLMDGWDGETATIAYLGNGPFANFDGVPPDSKFYVDGGAAKDAAGAPTAAIQANDVFCVKLQGGTVPGHAWMQFTSSGDAYDSPTFVFRVRNDSTPYYLYDQSFVGATLQDTTSGDCVFYDPGW